MVYFKNIDALVTNELLIAFLEEKLGAGCGTLAWAWARGEGRREDLNPPPHRHSTAICRATGLVSDLPSNLTVHTFRTLILIPTHGHLGGTLSFITPSSPSDPRHHLRPPLRSSLLTHNNNTHNTPTSLSLRLSLTNAKANANANVDADVNVKTLSFISYKPGTYLMSLSIILFRIIIEYISFDFLR